MSCLFTRNILSCGDFVLGGIKNVYMTNHSLFTNIYYNTGDTKQSEISMILPTGITWYEFTTLSLSTIAFEKEVITNNGRWFFQKEFDCTFDYLEPFKRSVLMELINSNNITIAWQSNNGNWFIMGDDYPCKVIDYGATTDNIKGNNQYSIKLGTEGRYQMRALSQDYVNNYILPFNDIIVVPDCEYFTSHALYNSLDGFVYDYLDCYVNI